MALLMQNCHIIYHTIQGEKMRKHPVYENPKMRAPTAKTPYYTIEVRKPLELGEGRGNRLVTRSTKCTRRTDAQARVETITEEIWRKFDKQLGIERDPFILLITEGLERIRDDNTATPRLDKWNTFHDFLFEPKNPNDNKIKSNSWSINSTINISKFDRYLNFRKSNLDYLPKRRTDKDWNNTNYVNESVHPKGQKPIFSKGYISESYEQAWKLYFNSTTKTISLRKIKEPPEYLNFMPRITDSDLDTKEFIIRYGRQCAVTSYFFAFNGEISEVNNLFIYLNDFDARVLRRLIDNDDEV